MYVLNPAVLIEVHVLASPTTTKVHAVAMRSGGREVDRVAEEPEVRGAYPYVVGDYGSGALCVR